MHSRLASQGSCPDLLGQASHQSKGSCKSSSNQGHSACQAFPDSVQKQGSHRSDNTKQSTRAQGTEACNAAKEKWEKEKVSEAAWCTRRHQKEIIMQQTGVTYGMDCDTAGLPVIVCVSKPEQPLQAQDQLEHLCSDYISMMDCHHVRHNIGCMFDCMCWQLL